MVLVKPHDTLVANAHLNNERNASPTPGENNEYQEWQQQETEGGGGGGWEEWKAGRPAVCQAINVEVISRARS